MNIEQGMQNVEVKKKQRITPGTEFLSSFFSSLLYS